MLALFLIRGKSSISSKSLFWLAIANAKHCSHSARLFTDTTIQPLDDDAREPRRQWKASQAPSHIPRCSEQIEQPVCSRHGVFRRHCQPIQIAEMFDVHRAETEQELR